MKAIINRLLESGLTQNEISEKIGCSQPTISEILSGKNRNPSMKLGVRLIRMCEERGLSWSLEELDNGKPA